MTKYIRPEKRRAILTRAGFIVQGEDTYRPGDPIMGPDNRVTYVEVVYPGPKPPADAGCIQGVLPLD